MVLEGGQPVQAFPLTPTTFQGVASNLKADGFTLIHALEDGSITVDFDNKSLTVPVVAGMDFALDPQCNTISSTNQVLIS